MGRKGRQLAFRSKSWLDKICGSPGLRCSYKSGPAVMRRSGETKTPVTTRLAFGMAFDFHGTPRNTVLDKVKHQACNQPKNVMLLLHFAVQFYDYSIYSGLR